VVFGSHPANLAFRFVLEIAALIAIGVGAYNLASGFFAWMLGIGLPVIVAVGWGTFNVPGDKSRSGMAPVVVRGVIRLVLELLVFTTAVVLLWFVSPIAATVLGVGVAIHYLLSIDRIRWLLAS
jgi:Protein of unknown function (DUF2568)